MEPTQLNTDLPLEISSSQMNELNVSAVRDVNEIEHLLDTGILKTTMAIDDFLIEAIFYKEGPRYCLDVRGISGTVSQQYCRDSLIRLLIALVFNNATYTPRQ